MDKPNYFAIIPAEVRYDSNLKANEKLLYAELTSLCNKNGYCYASNQYFANLYEVNKKTISSWVSNLSKREYIRVEVDKGAGNDRKVYIKKSIPIHQKMDAYPSKDGELYNNSKLNNKKNNKPNIPIDFLIDAWNKTFENTKVPTILSIKGKRLTHTKKRWEENPDKQFFVDYFNKINQSQFLSGRNNTWICNFDWAINPNNMQKVLEGNYSSEQNNQDWFEGLKRMGK